MIESEQKAKNILEKLGFEKIEGNKEKLQVEGASDLVATYQGRECVIEVKSVKTGGITKNDPRPTATLKRHQMCKMAEDKQEGKRAFVFYLDDEGRYFLFELKNSYLKKE